MTDAGAIHRDIMDLKARSLLAVDEKRWDDFARCFTDDARIDYSRAAPPGSGRPAPVIPSIDVYVGVASAHVADAKTMHIPSIPVIQVLNPDRAKATWKVEEVFVRPPGSERASHRGYFVYEDEYRLTADGWRISALTFIPWFSTRLDP
jgi:hypothetical protein